MADSFDRLQQLCDHIRAQQPEPLAGLDPRRVAIYRELFFNNLNQLLGRAFPIIQSLLAPSEWLGLIRGFLCDHQAQTPYFPRLSEEFLGYLQTLASQSALPRPFLAELAHYEWLELALDIAEDPPEAIAQLPEGDLLQGRPLLNPLLHNMRYGFPVHRLGQEYQPREAPMEPTHLLVYRCWRTEQVRFTEINPVTARLIELLGEREEASGAECLQALAAELGLVDRDALLAFGRQLLQQLVAEGALLGSCPLGGSA